MTKEELCDAALEELSAIEQGTVAVTLIEGDILVGDVRYRTSHGWTFIVFSDGAEWDYIHTVRSPSGEELKVWPDAAKSPSVRMQQLANYHPPGEQSKTLWGFMD